MAFFLYDDLVTDPATLVRTLFEFLEVDPEFCPEIDARYNSSNLPKGKLLRGLFRPSRLKSAIKTTLPNWALRPVYSVAERVRGRSELEDVPPIREETRRTLLDGYRDDILRLQDLIGHDLSQWLEVSAPAAG